MKLFLLSILFLSTFSAGAQADKVTSLPPGIYAVQGSSASTWVHGDIVLLDDSHYKTGSENAGGEYKFSVTAQRILFVSGPLKGAFAKTTVRAGTTAIILPLKENQEVGFKLTMDVWAHHKKN